MSERRIGIVGRTVRVEGESEVCEVMACQVFGDYGHWSVLVARTDGTLMEVAPNRIRLVGDPGVGPYR